MYTCVQQPCREVALDSSLLLPPSFLLCLTKPTSTLPEYPILTRLGFHGSKLLPISPSSGRSSHKCSIASIRQDFQISFREHFTLDAIILEIVVRKQAL